jgi:hypothetical protein
MDDPNSIFAVALVVVAIIVATGKLIGPGLFPSENGGRQMLVALILIAVCVALYFVIRLALRYYFPPDT